MRIYDLTDSSDTGPYGIRLYNYLRATENHARTADWRKWWLERIGAK